MASLPNGLIKPSPTEVNVSDLAAVARCVRTLTDSGSTRHGLGKTILPDLPRRIGVLLPDTTVRVTLLHFEKLPVRQEERDAVIRWRLGQEQLFPLNGAKVSFQVLHDRWEGNGSVHTVLTVAIQESVLRQYESLCESVGLIPQEVGSTSLRMFDLWRRFSKGFHWRSRNVLWVNISDRALTTLICQQGRLLLYRCKLLGDEAAEPAAATGLLETIFRECCVSLEICQQQQQHPSAAIKEAVVCVDGDISIFQRLMKTELGMSVEQLGWESVEALGGVTKDSHRGVTALAAMAGVL
jgi:hypothetical protein